MWYSSQGEYGESHVVRVARHKALDHVARFLQDSHSGTLAVVDRAQLAAVQFIQTTVDAAVIVDP